MIASSYFTLAIVAMAIITFAMRYVFFIKLFQIKLSPILKIILSFTAPCILIAMVTPIMFQEVIASKTIGSMFGSPYLLAGFCTVIFSIYIRNTLLVIILSMVIFYALRTVL